MSRIAGGFACRACDARTARWVGRCPRCGEYGSVEEARSSSGTPLRAGGTLVPSRPAASIKELASAALVRTSTGVGEFDRVLGGGLVPGQVVLLAGEPGVGKSTLLLAVAEGTAARAAQSGRTVLYVSAEESAEQIGVRAVRIGATSELIRVADESTLEGVIAHFHACQPVLLIVDSVQTVASTDVDGRAGGVAQVQAVTQALTTLAKSTATPILLIGQSSRENAVAGPRALEHLVDTVLTFEGERHTTVRVLRAAKNRYGPAEEVACFEQKDDGLREVSDPSLLFRSQRESPVPGTCVAVTLEGKRALLAEVQALVAGGAGPSPRRVVTGLDSSRVAMLAAVTNKVGRIRLAERDLFVATVGGLRLSDPATDLAVCLAIAAAAWDVAMPPDVIAVGEIALSGDVRPVPGLDRRVAEAARLGFRRVLVPPGDAASLVTNTGDVKVVPVGHVDRALTALRDLASALPRH